MLCLFFISFYNYLFFSPFYIDLDEDLDLAVRTIREAEEEKDATVIWFIHVDDLENTKKCTKKMQIK